MNRRKLIIDQIYYDQSARLFAVTPDKVGVYWYDTREEAFEQHGEQTVHYVERIEEW